jgi:Flp pilus assembly protein TadG
MRDFPSKPSTVPLLGGVRRRALTAATYARTEFHRLRADCSGNISMLFAFMIVPVVGIIAFSVDYGRALNERTALQTAMDSAVLAAGRNYQVDGNATGAETVAHDYFMAAMESHEGAEVVQNEVDADTLTMKFSAKVGVKTTFGRLLGINQLEVTSSSEATLAAGGLDKNLEVALMLDLTGSMCSPCSKIGDLKEAATDLVNIIIQDDQSTYTSRVALVPFSHAVNVGSDHFEAVTGEQQVVEDVYDYPASCYKSGKLKKSCKGNPDYLVVEGHSYSSCVVERPGADKFTDAAPGAGKYLGVFDLKREDAHGGPDDDTDCEPADRVMAMSSDKAGLVDAINSFETGGWTAGHLGTAWAYYMLSPKWNGIWGGVDANAAEFADTGTMKVAILMTDGDYNAYYEAANGTSAAQAKAVCAKMKQDGITVYTVGFMVSSSAKQLLRDECATSASHFFDATNGEELKLAFRQIAFTIAQLRLSK